VTDPIQSKARIREVLLPQPSGPASEMLWLTGASPEALERMRSSLSATPIPAAVLVPLVERERGLTVLLTQRSTRLKAHA
jgi:hypothetical protein